MSGLIAPHGPPAKIITHWPAGDFTRLYTEATLKGLEDVLNWAWLTRDYVPEIYFSS